MPGKRKTYDQTRKSRDRVESPMTFHGYEIPGSDEAKAPAEPIKVAPDVTRLTRNFVLGIPVHSYPTYD